MAAPVPSSLLSLPKSTQIPISPPPEYSIFPKIHPLLGPQILRTFTPEGCKTPDLLLDKQQPSLAPSVAKPDTKSEAAQDSKPEVSKSGPPFPVPDLGNPSFHPQYLSMVSRVAAFYQQQCRAAAEVQNQKCQEWANAHRLRLQEMTRAATLVVAWYIRDRVQRRRKKQRRRFRRGLSEKVGRDGITKGEAVRKWMQATADQPLPSEDPGRDAKLDLDEETFDIDGEAASSADGKLLNEANNIINSQLARAQLPVLGMVSFDASDTESEDDDMEDASVDGQSEACDELNEEDEEWDLERYEEVGPFHCEEEIQ